MIERIEYTEKNGKAQLVRIYGTGAGVRLPDEVDGLPVTGLWDHCFAPSASVRVDESQIRSAASWRCYSAEKNGNAEGIPPEGDAEAAFRAAGDLPYSGIRNPGTDTAALCGAAVEEIALPGTLQETGDYCFYGCTRLKKLSFPAGFQRLGGGNFVAANHIEELEFILPESAEEDIKKELTGTAMINYGHLGNITPDCLKDIIGEVTYETGVTVRRYDGRLLYSLQFPGYYETGEENTPARIIEIKYDGTGYKFRQCFHGRELSFKLYDEQFYEASVQEMPDTVLRLVLKRLLTPLRMEDKERQDYIAWLQQEHALAAEYILRGDRIEVLEMLCRLKQPAFFTREILTYFQEQASQAQNAQAVSILMDYQRKNFRVQRRRYSFD